MNRTPLQDKAIAWFAEQHDAVPQLSSHPVYYFRKRDGTVLQRNILNLLEEFKRWREENKRKKKESPDGRR